MTRAAATIVTMTNRIVSTMPKPVCVCPMPSGEPSLCQVKNQNLADAASLRAKIVTVSRAATIAGRVNYQSRDLSRIGALGERHSQELRSAAKEARYLASEFERAAEHLAPSQRRGENHQSATAAEDGPTLVEFLQKLRAYFVQEFARGRDVDQIFDDLEESYKSAQKVLGKS
jgi:hypothetical protein